MPVSGLIAPSLSSIIAVHGLNGDATNTWKHPKNNHFWLQDSLPLDVKGARILSYGYNADVAFGNTTVNVWDHAKSLLGSLIDERETDDVRHYYPYQLQTQLRSSHIAWCIADAIPLDDVGIQTAYHLHCAFIRGYHCQTGSCLGT